jgi:hypothetical protein
VGCGGQACEASFHCGKHPVRCGGVLFAQEVIQTVKVGECGGR